MNDQSGDREPIAKIPIPGAMAGGALMGCSDAVPGVSGGTMAMILGIYDEFIGALGIVLAFPRRWKEAEARRELGVALRLLIPLGLGLGLGYLLTVKLLVGGKGHHGLLQRPETAPFCYAFFFGLVLISLREPWKRLTRVRQSSWVLALAGAATSFMISGLPGIQETPEVWMLFFGGAAAIAVMLLPGISGSLLLLTLNQYQMVSEGITSLDLVVIATFLGGIALGAALFIPFLKRLLSHYHDGTMAVLTGLMAGSLRSLWPWKNNYDHKAGPMQNVEIGDGLPLAIGMLLLGGLFILVITRLEHKLKAPSS